MKFEIEDNFVVIDTGEGFTELVRLQDLEQILQAVKKTQTKLINREIQAVQDSKNEKVVERTGLGYIKSVIIDGTKHTADEIEQNQNIVDALLNAYKQDPFPRKLEGTASPEKIRVIMREIVKSATGKDIKDL